ncbi:MAG: acyl-CoA synthetase [Myxococcota bacterium]
MSDAPSLYPGAWAARTPDKPAIVMAETGATLTYGELDDAANRLSSLLADAGLAPGDHAALCMENRLEYLAVVWGMHYAGLDYTAISSRLTAEELAYILEDSGSRAFVASPYKADAVARAGDAVARMALRLSVGGGLPGFERYEAAIAAAPASPLPERVEGQPMLYSSGTTGRPKGVKLRAGGKPLGTGEALTALIAGLFGANADSVYLSPAPLYHSAPLRYCTQFLRLGATVVVMERFDAEGALAAIERFRVTHSQWVPTMFVRMLKLPEETRARYDVSSLRFAVHASAPCPVAVKRQMMEWWGPVIHEYYAGTEGNGFVYCSPSDWLAHEGSVGKALTAPVHIVDDDGHEVPVGEEGTVYFEGPADGRGFEYHNDPEKTASSFLPNGWSTLGDVGRLDADGFLYLTDRKANMIISGGVNIYPQETENVLTLHPKVHDVAVFGVPNEDFGEEVKAVVQPIDMRDAGPALERELIAYCREHLADVKCPRSVDFRDELPRHPTGKLYKRLLKDEYWKGHATRIL